MLKMQYSANQDQASVSSSGKVALPFIVKGVGIDTEVGTPSVDGTSSPATASNTGIALDAEDHKHSRLEQVMRLAQRGCRLFPLSPNSKVPMKGFEWKELATNDEAQVLMWFNNFPECNWAVATGSESKVFVLDVDGGEGRKSLDLLADQGHVMPPTLITETGKPLSYHCWFAYPNDGNTVLNSASKLAPSLDIRGQGGYVVVPPSIHPNGTFYVFSDETIKIAAAPEWLLDLIAQTVAQQPYQPAADPQGEPILTGERHAALLSLAGAMRRKGCGEEAILAALKITNANRCKPPKSKQEVEELAHDVSCRYPPATDDRLTTPKLTLHPAALYGVAGKVVNTIFPHTEADEAALLLHFLAGYGNLVGRSAYCIADGTKHYSNVFFVCVGATAEGKKGTSWNRIQEVLEPIDLHWTKTCVQKGLSSGEGLIAAVASVVEPKPDAASTTASISDKRLFVVQPEFASTLKVMTREGNVLSGIIREAWDSGCLQTMVKRNPLHVEGAHISIVGHITREELRRYLNLTESANGFANRFLWIQSNRSKFLPEGGSLSAGEMKELAELVRPAVKFGSSAELLKRDEETKKLWADSYRGLCEGKPGMLGAIISRAAPQVLRLSMIYALLDCSLEIKTPHLRAALAVWEFCEKTAMWIFGSRMGDSTADELLSLLLKRAGGMSRNEIMNHFNRHKSSAEIGRALALLQKQGHVCVEGCKTGGREAEIWMAVESKEDSQRGERGKRPS
jgi:hypothetical protein